MEGLRKSAAWYIAFVKLIFRTPLTTIHGKKFPLEKVLGAPLCVVFTISRKGHQTTETSRDPSVNFKEWIYDPNGPGFIWTYKIRFRDLFTCLMVVELVSCKLSKSYLE